MTSKRTMTDLFMLDPLEMTNEDIDEIIARYREKRRDFLSGPAPRTAAKKASAKPKATDGLNLDLDL